MSEVCCVSNNHCLQLLLITSPRHSHPPLWRSPAELSGCLRRGSRSPLSWASEHTYLWKQREWEHWLKRRADMTLHIHLSPS